VFAQQTADSRCWQSWCSWSGYSAADSFLG